ncbi:MAG TPA: glutathione S-transferase family protein [Phenylobacterium sp.]|nr:glutathione S-transferase family protein [Phenylobacterium sp.]
MLVVHHLGVSQSDRIVWLCEELELPYQLVRYDRTQQGGGPDSYKALHPYGTAPVIQDGEVLLGESGAIIDYVIAKHGNGRLAVGRDHPDFADYLYWFHFANGTFMASGMMALGLILADIEISGTAAQLKARWDRAFELADQRLGEAPYFAGDSFSAADIMMHFPLTTMRMFVPHDISRHPNILAYLQRIAERPAFKRARQKGDPDMPLNLT